MPTLQNPGWNLRGDRIAMIMGLKVRQPYFEAVDAILMPLGYKRRRSDTTWTRKVGADVAWVNFNLGSKSIQPIAGVTYADLESLFPPELRVKCRVSRSLKKEPRVLYSLDDPPENVASAVKQVGLPAIERLRDRDHIIDLLQEYEPAKWPVTLGHSARIRLLPILLESSGRHSEALARLAEFEQLTPLVDQLLPKYSTFAQYFRARWADGSDRSKEIAP